MLKEVNCENISCKALIKHFNRFVLCEDNLRMGIPHLNDLWFLFLEFLAAVAYTVLTELNEQKLFSRGMASIKSTASYIS